ncbi:MAG TPA: DUF58 domain-containing protein [Campylobacterales bacterium]|nr:DUF58 domain-containing protein [Campylobacterales bacterium]
MMDTKFQTILLRAKEDVYTHLSGGNLSRILGEGYDFAELQEYQSTDDIRHISWVNSAKLGKTYVKKMHEERELNITVCSLIDGRMVIGDKQELLSYIVALLGYSAYSANDLFGAISIFGSDIKEYEPTKNIEVIEQSIYDIYDFEPLGKSINYAEVPSKLMQTIEAKSLLFIIGDFLDDIDLSILSQKHEVVAVIVRDTWEENPIASPNAQLINPQTNRAINQTLSIRAIREYRSKLLEHDNRLIKQLNSYNIRYAKVYNIDEVIGKFNKSIL